MYLPVCILPYAVENNIFSVEKSTGFVDKTVDKNNSLKGVFTRKQKAEILIKEFQLSYFFIKVLYQGKENNVFLR